VPKVSDTIEECSSALKRLYLKSRIIKENIKFYDVEPSLNKPNGLSLVLKSIHEPSIDEIPIYNTLVDSFNLTKYMNMKGSLKFLRETDLIIYQCLLLILIIKVEV
jgi:hypothetical protein